MLPQKEQFRESFKWHFFKPAKKALVIYIFTIIPELIIAYLIAIREEYSVKNRNYFNRLIEIHGEYVLVYNSRARRTSLKGTAPVLHHAKPADILLGRSKALMEQAAGLHMEFEEHSLPHQRIPRCTHPRHEYLHSACCTFSGRISGFFFALRGLHRRGRGFTHTTGFKGLHSKKCAAAQQRVF